MKAAATLTAPVISVQNETVTTRCFQDIYWHFPPSSRLGSLAVWRCVCVGVFLCVCVCCLTQTGWASRSHGPSARLDPSRGTKLRGVGRVRLWKEERCQVCPIQRPGLGFAPKEWSHLGGARGLRQPGGLGGIGGCWGATSAGPPGLIQPVEGSASCSFTLKSACFCTLYNLIRFFRG